MNSTADFSKPLDEGQEVKAIAAQRENADEFGHYLLDSLGSGTLAIVQHFLDGDPNVSVRDSSGRTPLILAVHQLGHTWKNNNNYPKVIARIVDLGAAVNAQDNDGKTALMEASDHGNLEMVQILVGAGADVNIRDKRGDTALHYAVNYAGCVTALLSAGADPNVVGKVGNTPLMKTVSGYRYGPDGEIVQALLKAGADLNILTPRYDSALLMACENHRDKSIKILLSRGADITVRDQNSRTPLMIYLMNCGRSMDIDVINALVQRSIPIDRCDNQGKTALMYACGKRGASIAFEALLDASADIHACDDNGWSPLMHAAALNIGGYVKTLIDRGADVNIGDGKGRTPLIVASQIKGRNIDETFLIETLDVLVNAGADIKAEDHRRNTASVYLYKNERNEAWDHLGEKLDELKAESEARSSHLPGDV